VLSHAAKLSIPTCIITNHVRILFKSGNGSLHHSVEMFKKEN
jgi:hypothetical protein